MVDCVVAFLRWQLIRTPGKPAKDISLYDTLVICITEMALNVIKMCKHFFFFFGKKERKKKNKNECTVP